jgi:hypothetical protein
MAGHAGQGEKDAAAARRRGPHLDHFGRASAVDQIHLTAADKTFGRPRTGALAAMEPAAPILHGRLAAGMAGAGFGAAAGSGGIIARRIAVPQPPPPNGGS